MSGVPRIHAIFFTSELGRIHWLILGMVKGAKSDFVYFFPQTFRDFDITILAYIFLITLGKFYSWKMFCFKDINHNVPGYGNHI